ncbi:LysR family substrate-binding domain-containing protein [Brevibacterium sp. FME17]|uniref:LysR family substrate-binding domain-containing protein n=1 Tax=Brevibacterium sp. FME17 TaxID=2742606 RepID=UPI00299F876E|nr:LysR family substrate-binding domain-containing protein [Brevibacterium sp. FME17]
MEKARAVLSSVDELVTVTRATSTGEVGGLTVGYILSGAYDTIPRLSEAAASAFPGLRVDSRELWPAQLDAGLLDGELDLVIAHTMTARPEFRREPLRTDPLVAVTRPTNPATSREGPVRLGEAFDGQTFVFYDPKYAPEHYALLTKALDIGGGSHQVRLDMTPGLRNIALPDDDSFTLIPESMAPFLPRTVREVILDTSNLPALDVELVWHRERESPILLSFLTIAREVNAEHRWMKW